MGLLVCSYIEPSSVSICRALRDSKGLQGSLLRVVGGGGTRGLGDGGMEVVTFPGGGIKVIAPVTDSQWLPCGFQEEESVAEFCFRI